MILGYIHFQFYTFFLPLYVDDGSAASAPDAVNLHDLGLAICSDWHKMPLFCPSCKQIWLVTLLGSMGSELRLWAEVASTHPLSDIW